MDPNNNKFLTYLQAAQPWATDLQTLLGQGGSELLYGNKLVNGMASNDSMNYAPSYSHRGGNDIFGTAMDENSSQVKDWLKQMYPNATQAELDAAAYKTLQGNKRTWGYGDTSTDVTRAIGANLGGVTPEWESKFAALDPGLKERAAKLVELDKKMSDAEDKSQMLHFATGLLSLYGLGTGMESLISAGNGSLVDGITNKVSGLFGSETPALGTSQLQGVTDFIDNPTAEELAKAGGNGYWNPTNTTQTFGNGVLSNGTAASLFNDPTTPIQHIGSSGSLLDKAKDLPSKALDWVDKDPWGAAKLGLSAASGFASYQAAKDAQKAADANGNSLNLGTAGGTFKPQGFQYNGGGGTLGVGASTQPAQYSGSLLFGNAPQANQTSGLLDYPTHGNPTRANPQVSPVNGMRSLANNQQVMQPAQNALRTGGVPLATYAQNNPGILMDVSGPIDPRYMYGVQ